MNCVGFDSIVLSKPILEDVQIPDGVSPAVYKPLAAGASSNRGYEMVFKAMIGASVTTHNEDRFWANYDRLLEEILTRRGVSRKKSVYKAAHLTKQFLHETYDVIIEILNGLADDISRIDIYSAYYNQPYVSCFGEAQGQRLLPVDFVEKNQEAFPHVCAWKYLMQYHYEPDIRLQLDNFSGKLTPAWRVLDGANINLNVFFSGCECNPLISTADIVLRLIEKFQYGNVDGRTLLAPLEENLPSLGRKLRFNNLGGSGEDRRNTAPVLNIDINTWRRIKRPIYYILWKDSGNKALKSAFEWGQFYNSVMRKVIETKGCVKFYSEENDFLNWNPQTDFVVPVTKEDEQLLDSIKDLGHDIPTIYRPNVTHR